jgi:hypothetical protein
VEVEPQEEQITVRWLEKDQYIEHGLFGSGTQATSLLLSEFSVNVAEVFAAAETND